MKLIHDARSTAEFLRRLADELEAGATLLAFDHNDWSAAGKMQISLTWRVDRQGNPIP